MNILAFDSAGEILSVALQLSNGELYGSFRRAGLKHSESLLPEVDAVLKKTAISAGDLDLIVCTRGPGSFTGLRIGMATAKGLAAGAGCSYVSIHSCDLYASMIPCFDGLVVPVQDARKRRVYAAIYDKNERISDYLDVAPLNLLEKLYTLNRKVLFTGPDAEMMQNHGAEREDFSYAPASGDTAVALIGLGRKHFLENGADDESAGPVYLRPSEAEIGRGKSNV